VALPLCLCSFFCSFCFVDRFVPVQRSMAPMPSVQRITPPLFLVSASIDFVVHCSFINLLWCFDPFSLISLRNCIFSQPCHLSRFLHHRISASSLRPCLQLKNLVPTFTSLSTHRQAQSYPYTAPTRMYASSILPSQVRGRLRFCPIGRLHHPLPPTRRRYTHRR
jgi:hypothetical protein